MRVQTLEYVERERAPMTATPQFWVVLLTYNGTAVVIEGRNFQEKALADIDGKTLGAFQRLDERTLLGVTAASKEGPADVHVQPEDIDGYQPRRTGS